ncbi:uncharacterized protein LOC130130999 [Lampris incognitus]|uniref:uncharacterized protein LOC130130999 n=1 Tax=Lampris incognitus TaxID=2546036 RepID=UPI0024B4E9AF|nr:uncharacterized protein LOC130130999 [Lampris incognitus]
MTGEEELEDVGVGEMEEDANEAVEEVVMEEDEGKETDIDGEEEEALGKEEEKRVERVEKEGPKQKLGKKDWAKEDDEEVEGEEGEGGYLGQVNEGIEKVEEEGEKRELVNREEAEELGAEKKKRKVGMKEVEKWEEELGEEEREERADKTDLEEDLREEKDWAEEDNGKVEEEEKGAENGEFLWQEKKGVKEVEEKEAMEEEDEEWEQNKGGFSEEQDREQRCVDKEAQNHQKAAGGHDDNEKLEKKRNHFMESIAALNLEAVEDAQQDDLNECQSFEDTQTEDTNGRQQDEGPGDREDPPVYTQGGRKLDQMAEGGPEDHLALEEEQRKPWSNECCITEALTTQVERRGKEGGQWKKENSESKDDEETDTESQSHKNRVPALLATQFQDRLEKPSEDQEGTTDEEEIEFEHLTEEDTESEVEDVLKVYSKDDHPTDIFHTLKEFRESSLLTDLTLSTEDGERIPVHSPVLAAVSSLIRERLWKGDRQNTQIETANNYMNAKAQRWSVSLCPEVSSLGLHAVLEFAYTGAISAFNRGTGGLIQTAACVLGVPRVLDLCNEEEEKSMTNDDKKAEWRISASEQMNVTLQSIREMWVEKVGCDVILEAVKGSLQVHRVILAASSDYFRAMFTSGMKESYQHCVTLPFIQASELEALIGCSYSGMLPLRWGCVFEITGTSLQLQYQPALSLCFDFMQQEINPHSCLDVVSFAEAYKMVQLLEVSEDFVLRQFQKVARTSKFKDLPAKQLLRYLNSHSLCVSSELVVFRAVMAWIQAHPKTTLKLAKELMKTIQFPLMTFKEFKEVQTMNILSNHCLAELYETIFEEFCSNSTTPQSQCRIYMPKESLVLVGGDKITEDLSKRSTSRELWFGNSLRNHTGIVKAMEWRKLGEMPEPERFSHEVAVLRGQLYVVGGRNYYGLHDILNSAYRYDPLQNSWERLPDMQEYRCSFSLVVLNEMLYAIGGDSVQLNLGSVERFCLTTNSWSFTHSLDMALSGHVAKVLDKQIHISGGLSDGYQCVASLFLYDPERGSTYLAGMSKPRAHHCMETMGSHLYVAGGITVDDNMVTIDQLACEVYNPLDNSWTSFTSLPVPHVGAGSAVLEGKFYVLGGYSQEDYSDTKLVHRYDPAATRWENMGRMPGPNNDIGASLLCLPAHLRS